MLQHIVPLCVCVLFFFFIKNTLIVKDRKFDNNWNMTPPKSTIFYKIHEVIIIWGV